MIRQAGYHADSPFRQLHSTRMTLWAATMTPDLVNEVVRRLQSLMSGADAYL